MFDHMVKSNNLLHEFKKYGFEDMDLDFIKEQIAGPKDCADRKVSFAPFSDVLLLLAMLLLVLRCCTVFVSGWSKVQMICIYVCILRARSSLLWTHTLRPFYSRPIALTQEGRSLVNDVCECVRD